MTKPSRRGRIVAPSLGAGILLALSLPPWGWWPLGLVGAALLYWRLAGLPLPAGLWSGWLAGLGCYGLGLMWARAFNWYGALALVLIEALFLAAQAALTPSRWGRAPAFVGAGVLAEWARMSWPFGGLPLGGVFLGQAHGPLLQMARLGGPLLLTAAVWLGGVGLATMVVAGRQRRAGWPSGSATRGVALVAVVAALVLGGSLAPDGGTPRRHLTVALVQGGGRRGVSMEEVAPSTVYGAQVSATLALLRTHRTPRLVLWPEDVLALPGPLRGSRCQHARR